MLEFKSEKTVINNNSTIFIVKNDKDRKVTKNTFSDLYPSVKIDDKVYGVKEIDCMSISFVPKDSIIGISIK